MMGTVRSICILALLSSLPLSATAADQTGASNSSTLPVQAQPIISAAIGKNDPRYQVRQVEEGFRLENARHNLIADFTKNGVSVRSGTGLWTIALHGYGYSGTLKPLSLSRPHAKLNRVEYQHGSLTEWYVNGPVGLEQGFTIKQAPEKREGQPLTIELALSGEGSSVDNDKGGEGLLLSGHDGEAILRYRGFIARDASGRPLRMSEKLDGNRLLLTIEESDAKYPITVDPWVQLAKLTSSDPLAYNFGLTVAISGNTIVVGAPYATVGTTQWQGAAYVFVKPPSGWANMTQTAMLTASNGGLYNNFGWSVAIDKSTIIVGSPSYHAIGAAYVFVKPESGWTDMTQTATLLDTGQEGDFVGMSVAVSGDTVVATSTVTRNFSAGAAYVYVKPPGGWTDANQTATLTPSDGKQGDFFGYSSSISGDTVVVGSPNDLTPGGAYVFVKPKSGWPQTMTETAKLTASDGKENDFLGLSVTTDATTAVIGAPYAPWKNNFGPGAAYVFVKPPSGWKNTTERAKLTASDGKSGDYFGNSLSLSGDLLAVGAPLATVGAIHWQGLTYLFHKPKDGWKTTSQFAAKVTSADGAANDNFGFSVSLSGATVIAGSPYASTNAGYVFQFHSTN